MQVTFGGPNGALADGGGLCDPALGCPAPATPDCEMGCDGCEVLGDLNANGVTNVVDVQCGIGVILWSLAGAMGAAPACLALPPSAADLQCDGAVDVADALLLIALSLSGDLPHSIDADHSGCADACETPMGQGD